MIYKHTKVFIPSLSFVLTLIFLMVACSSRGQVTSKKELKIVDYPIFGHLQFDKSTRDGSWVSFYMTYKNGKDTLFVKNTINDKKYSFSAATNTAFVANQHFVYKTEAGLHLLSLESGAQQIIPSVTEYASSSVSNQLVTLNGRTGSEKYLLIIDQFGNTKKKISKVVYFTLSPNGKEIAFVTKSDSVYALGLLELDKQNSTRLVIDGSPNDFKTLTWGKEGKSLAFINKNKVNSDRSSLFYYRTDLKLLYTMNPETQTGFPRDKTIDNAGSYRISISDDLNRVFFGLGPDLKTIHNNSNSSVASAVEIWNGNDKWIYPRRLNGANFERLPNLAVWFPKAGELMQVSSATLPKLMLTGRKQYALLSNPLAYEPQFELEGPRDFYLLNLNTKEKELFLQKQFPTPEKMGFPNPSPGGDYISYFLENKLWTYNLATKTHVMINSNELKEPFHKIAGWTPGDEEIVLYDQYDVWIAAPDGSYCKRITRGREKEIQFKIYESSLSFKGGTSNYDGFTSKLVCLTKGLLLEAKGVDQKTGYFKWEKNGGEIPIVYKDSFINELETIGGGGAYLYQEQKFDQSPRLMFLKGKTTRILFKSNVVQENYYWGSTRLIEFQNLDGKKSNALLHYPANYDPTKKYPMIVNIYEQQSQNVYKFKNPSLEEEAGFNTTVLTNMGYFVLCPDIFREKQKEGQSALAATVSATKKVISMGLVYPDKIGLSGHSFGGYETNYIITQTGMFAAAVAGSAINDIKGFYHTVNWGSGFPTMNYFKSGQLKMDQSPFEIPEIYANNSPLTYADKVTTPLLAYSGKADYHVDWHQTVAFYMALRRLNKKHVMLLYPQEGHVILKSNNQIDLSTRIIQWFDYYLKDGKKQDWMNSK